MPALFAHIWAATGCMVISTILISWALYSCACSCHRMPIGGGVFSVLSSRPFLAGQAARQGDVAVQRLCIVLQAVAAFLLPNQNLPVALSRTAACSLFLRLLP